MKKTIIALMALVGVSAAETLTLTSPENNVLSTGTGTLSWLEETGTLTSWELSFDLTINTDGNKNLFSLNSKNDWVPTLDWWDKELQFNQANKNSIGKPALSAGETASITLSFVATKNADGEYVGGNYSVIFKMEEEIKFSSNVEIEEFGNGRTLSDYTISKGSTTFMTQNGATFSNITLTRLNDNVPEPTTATLSLLALAGLAARRRRK